MISTVTTTTVTTVTTIGIASALSLVAIIALLLLLVVKEVGAASSHATLQRGNRVLTIGIAPLVLAFIFVFVTKVVSFLS